MPLAKETIHRSCQYQEYCSHSEIEQNDCIELFRSLITDAIHFVQYIEYEFHFDDEEENQRVNI